MPKAILLEQPGGPENLKWKDIPDPKPAAGEVVLKQNGRWREFHRRLSQERPLQAA